MLVELGRLEEARPLVAAALRLNPQHPWAVMLEDPLEARTQARPARGAGRRDGARAAPRPRPPHRPAAARSPERHHRRRRRAGRPRDRRARRAGVARTGVTAIWPRAGTSGPDAVTAGFHSFNGNGEMTGTIWLEEQGLLATPVCITNTHSVGVVRDAVIAYAVRERVPRPWLLPVVAETYDGWLSEAERFPVTAAHAFAALDGAAGGAVAEGCVGGGTGMICHEFKGGIGTASRVGASRRGDVDGGRAGPGELRIARSAARRRRAGRPGDRPGRRAVASRRARRRRIDHRRPGDRRAARCRSSASGWPDGRPWASRGSAASAPTAAATSSWPSPPAIGCRWTRPCPSSG